jgi:hypothetical protein
MNLYSVVVFAERFKGDFSLNLEPIIGFSEINDFLSFDNAS